MDGSESADEAAGGEETEGGSQLSRVQDEVNAVLRDNDALAVTAGVLQALSPIATRGSSRILRRVEEGFQLHATVGLPGSLAAVSAWAAAADECALQTIPSCTACPDREPHGHHAAPLELSGECLGVLVLDTDPDPPESPALTALLETVATQLALAVARAETVRELGDAKAALTARLSRDALTGAASRNAVLERLREEMDRARRRKSALCVVLMDLDHFSSFNETWGTSAGDSALMEVAGRMRHSLRSYDVVGRFGGEEFLVVLPETTLDDGRIVAERLRRAIADTPISSVSSAPTLTASFGLAQFEDGQDATDLLTNVDEALLAAKWDGRNRVETAPD